MLIYFIIHRLYIHVYIVICISLYNSIFFRKEAFVEPLVVIPSCVMLMVNSEKWKRGVKHSPDCYSSCQFFCVSKDL